MGYSELNEYKNFDRGKREFRVWFIWWKAEAMHSFGQSDGEEELSKKREIGSGGLDDRHTCWDTCHAAIDWGILKQKKER